MEILAALFLLNLLWEACTFLSPDALEKRIIRLSARRRYIIAGREASAAEALRMRESYIVET